MTGCTAVAAAIGAHGLDIVEVVALGAMAAATGAKVELARSLIGFAAAASCILALLALATILSLFAILSFLAFSSTIFSSSSLATSIGGNCLDFWCFRLFFMSDNRPQLSSIKLDERVHRLFGRSYVHFEVVSRCHHAEGHLLHLLCLSAHNLTDHSQYGFKLDRRIWN